MVSSRRRLQPPPDTETGSIALALLASIIVAGLVTVVVAATLTGERSVRSDQQFTGALHVAESGVQQALHELNTGQLTGDTDSPRTGTVNGVPYEWTATQISSTEWTVTSTGGADGDAQRTIEALIRHDPLFRIAAFSRRTASFNGGNTADSYTSDEEAVPDDTAAWCTGNGRMGSNGALEFGSAEANGPCAAEYNDGSPRHKQTVDGVDLYNWQEGNDSPSRCNHLGGGENCYENNDPDQTWYVETHSEPLTFEDDIAWMEGVVDACGSAVQDRTYGDGAVIPPADSSTSGAVEVGFLSDHGAGPGDTYAYCTSSLTFDGIVELADGASLEDPVVFVVDGPIRFEGQNRDARFVNIGCDDSGVSCDSSFDPGSPRPHAAALQIYSPTSDADVDDQLMSARNHWKIAAAMYAPNGTCGGSSGSPQGDLYGSLICNDMASIGQWSFHYDDALADAVTEAHLSIGRWSEQ